MLLQSHKDKLFWNYRTHQNELTDAIINLGMDLSDLEAQLNGRVIFERYFIFKTN